MDASLALQTAIVAALDGDATLKAMIAGVFDEVPANTVFPFVQIGDVEDTDISATLSESWEHRVELFIWSTARGRKEIYQIAERIDALLHDQALALSGHALVNLLRVSRSTLRDSDEEGIRAGRLVYRAVTEKL
jgi:hypothetical protein